MASSYIPTSDTEFAAWLANFNTVAAANLELIGLSAADLTPSTTAKTALDTIITDFTAAQAAAKASTVAKRDAREAAETVARGLAQRVQVNPSVPQNVKEQLGLHVGGGQPAPAAPVAPTGLFVRGLDNGTNVLSWSGNGNRPNTQYLIECRCGGASAWTLVDVTTKTKYEHQGCKPGERAVYRIRAKRGDVPSGYSNEAVVYATA